MSAETSYSLVELCQLADVTPRTVRYYIQQGLLSSPGTTGPGTRYSEGHLDRLRVIRQLQRAHLPLSEIRSRLGALTDEDVRGILQQEPQAPVGSAIDYIRAVLGSKGVLSVSQRAAGPAAAATSTARRTFAVPPPLPSAQPAPAREAPTLSLPTAARRGMRRLLKLRSPQFRDDAPSASGPSASSAEARPPAWGAVEGAAVAPASVLASIAAPAPVSAPPPASPARPASAGSARLDAAASGASEAPRAAVDSQATLGSGRGVTPPARDVTPPYATLEPSSSMPDTPSHAMAVTPDRSTWERISLSPDIELHVRRPLSRPQNRLLTRFLDFARKLIQEDQP